MTLKHRRLYLRELLRDTADPESPNAFHNLEQHLADCARNDLPELLDALDVAEDALFSLAGPGHCCKELAEAALGKLRD